MSKPRHTRADRIQAGAAPGYAPKGAPDPERPDAPSPLRSLGLEGDKLLLYQLNLVQKTLAELRKKSDPTTYGLPDLLRPQTPEETPEAFLLRQNSELREFIQTKLKVTKAGKTRPIIVNRQMLVAVADLFYGRVKKAIWWKPRGGGGSLGAALIIWLRMVYHRTSFVDVAGALEQAKNVFEYVKDFWTNFPEMAQKLLDGEPTTSQIKLVNGTYLKCITNSEKAGRGKHPPALVCDEACQRDTKSDTGFEAAMNTVLSEPDPIILLLSTFHHPTGIFADHWAHAEEKGFTRYKWDCLLPGTPILTQRGLIPVETVVQGDMVLTEDGSWRPVNRIWSRPSGEAKLRIKVSGLSVPLGVTAGHRLMREDGTWVTAGEIKKGDRLHVPRPPQKPATISIPTLDYRYTDPYRGERVLEVDGDLGRWMGYFAGDGCAQGAGTKDNGLVYLSFNKGKDDFFIQDVVSISEKLFGHKVTVDTNAPGTVTRLRFRDRGLAEWLRGNCYAEDGKKTVPMQIVQAQPFEFLVGYLRADGEDPSRSTQEANCVRWGTNSEHLAACVMVAGLTAGMPTGLWPKAPYWFGAFTGKAAMPLFKAVNPGWTDRRAGKRGWNLNRVREDSVSTLVLDVEPVEYDGPVWDLAVDTVHSFVAGYSTAHNCFDIMAPCTEPIECSACPLTWTVEKRDIEGNTIIETQGCNGKARTSDGFQTYKATREAQLQNYGTDVFPVEFAGVRPDFRSKVIEDEWVEAAKIEEAEWEPGCTVAVGIDWGLTGQTALILTVHRGEDVCVVDSVFVSGVLVSGVITHLEAWWEALGPFEVYADGSHNYNNLELEQAGFPVVRVFFKKHKRTAYGNLVAYMVHRRLRILADQTTLLGQLRDLKRDKNGDIKKVNDHGPDALVCALLRFLFVQYYPGDLPAELLEELEGTGEAMSF